MSDVYKSCDKWNIRQETESSKSRERFILKTRRAFILISSEIIHLISTCFGTRSHSRSADRLTYFSCFCFFGNIFLSIFIERVKLFLLWLMTMAADGDVRNVCEFDINKLKLTSKRFRAKMMRFCFEIQIWLPREFPGWMWKPQTRNKRNMSSNCLSHWKRRWTPLRRCWCDNFSSSQPEVGAQENNEEWNVLVDF